MDANFSHLAVNDIDLLVYFNRKSKVPKALLKGKMNIKYYEHAEIIHKPMGGVSTTKRKKGKKFWFRIDDAERYSNQHLSSTLLCINNCQKNENEDRAEIRKIILWYMEIQKVLWETINIIHTI